MTLLAALLCPIATWMLSQAGVSGWSIAMPDGYRFEPLDDRHAAIVPATATGPIESVPRDTRQPDAGPMVLVGDELSPIGMVSSSVSGLVDTFAPVLADRPKTETASLPAARPAQAPARLRELDIHIYGLVATSAIFVWSAVTSILLIRLVLAWRSIGRLRRRAHGAEQSTVDVCRQLATKIGVAAPQVVRSPYLPSPCLAGLRRPAVLLPEGDQSVSLRDLLVHELAHLRRHDCHWNLLRRVATAIFFFQPLLWRLSRMIETTAEEVCDDYVVQFGGDRSEYASRLVDVAELSIAPIAPAGVGIVSLRSMLGQRVQRIMDTSRSLSTRVGNVLLVAVIIAGLISTVTVGLVGLDSGAAPAAEESASSDETSEASGTNDDQQQSETPHEDLSTIDVPSDEQPEPVRLTAAVDEDAQDSDESESNESDDETAASTFAGTVVDPSGNTVGGAKLYLIFYVPESTGLLEPTWQPIAVTSPDGSFRFSVQPGQFGVLATKFEFSQLALVATKPGFGFAWSTAGVYETSCEWQRDVRKSLQAQPEDTKANLQHLLEQVGKPLRLVKDDEPIRGRIVDINGQAVVGAKLTLFRVSSGVHDDLTAWRQAAALPKADYYSARMKTPRGMGGPQVRSLVAPATTDKDGRFVLRGVGVGRICELLMTASGIESAKIRVRSEAGEPILLDRNRSSPGSGSHTYYPAEFSLIAGPSVPIVGTVRDSVSRAPLAGITVKSQERHGERISGWGQDFVRAITNEKGRYHLEGMPVGRDNRIAAISPDGQVAYVSMSKRSATKGDQESVEVNFDLARGIWVTGQVTDQATGKGLSGWLGYYVPKESPHYRLTDTMHVDQRDRLRSGEDGKYRIAALPGPGLVTFMADNHQEYARADSILKPSGQSEKVGRTMLETGPSSLLPQNHHLVAEINPPEDAKTVNLDLKLDSGNRVTGRVVDPSGNLVVDYYFTGRLAQFGSWQPPTDGNFDLQGYDPTEPRHVYVVTTDHRQAAYRRVTGQVTDELVVQLLSAGSVRGRLVDADGAPLGNHSLYRWHPRTDPTDQKSPYHPPPLPRNLPNSQVGRYETDNEGKFKITGLVPGVEYRVSARDREGRPRPIAIGPLDVVIKVEPGEDKDLGDVPIADRTEFQAEAMQSKAGLMKTEPTRKAAGPIESGVASETPAVSAVGSDGSRPRGLKQDLNFEGKVVDPVGEPVHGAELFIVAPRIQWTGLLLADHESIARTAADGSFQFSISEEDFDLRAKTIEYASLVAVKPGFGFAWSVAGRFETSGRWLRQAREALDKLPDQYHQPETEPDFATAIRDAGKPLALVPGDVPIRGQVVDINGQGVAGARLTLIKVWGGNDDDLSAWRRAAAEPTADFYSTRTKTPWFIAGPEVRSIVEPAITDETGRFTLRGIGRGRIANLIIEGPRIASDELFVRTEVGEKITLLNQRSDPNMGSSTYYPSELRLDAGPSTPIVGVVRDKESGAPLAGVTVKSQERQGVQISGWGQDFVRAVTDASGRYRLEGMPIGDDNRIAAIAPSGGRAYFSQGKRAPTKMQANPIEIDFGLQRGVWVTGRVTDKDTGVGIFGRFVVNAKRSSPEDPSLNSIGSVDDRERWETGRNGRFRIVAMRKPGFVSFRAQGNDINKYPKAKGVLRPDGSVVDVDDLKILPGVRLRTDSYNVVAEMDPPADSQQIELNLQLQKTPTVRLRVVDSDGKAVTGFYYAWTTGLTSVGFQARPQYFWDWSGEPTLELKGYVREGLPSKVPMLPWSRCGSGGGAGETFRRMVRCWLKERPTNKGDLRFGRKVFAQRLTATPS